MNNTWLKSLWRWYEIIRRRVLVILFILFLLSTTLILIFFKNDLFYEVWLYDNQETLNNIIF